MKPMCCGILATTVLLLAGTIGATAQEGPAPVMLQMMQSPTMPMMRDMEQSSIVPMMAMAMMGMADHAEGRIAFLKAELKITDAQLPQWNTLADALRNNARHVVEMRGTMMQGGVTSQAAALNAPDRLDRMEKMMTAVLEMVRSTKTALGPLYAVLTDEQKKMADAVLRGPMGMMGSM